MMDKENWQRKCCAGVGGVRKLLTYPQLLGFFLRHPLPIVFFGTLPGTNIFTSACVMRLNYLIQCVARSKGPVRSVVCVRVIERKCENCHYDLIIRLSEPFPGTHHITIK